MGKIGEIAIYIVATTLNSPAITLKWHAAIDTVKILIIAFSAVADQNTLS